MFTAECLLHKNKCKFIPYGWQFSCHHITGRNIKELSWESVLLWSQIVYCAKISVSLYYKGWQFSCHLTTGRNVKDSSLENVLPQIVYCTKISVSSYYKRWKFCCHLIWFKAYTFVLQNTHKLRLLLCSFFSSNETVFSHLSSASLVCWCSYEAIM